MSNVCRQAVESQFWGPALYIAKLCGEAVFQETASKMAAASFNPGAPLHRLMSSLSNPNSGRFSLIYHMVVRLHRMSFRTSFLA